MSHVPEVVTGVLEVKFPAFMQALCHCVRREQVASSKCEFWARLAWDFIQEVCQIPPTLPG